MRTASPGATSLPPPTKRGREKKIIFLPGGHFAAYTGEGFTVASQGRGIGSRHICPHKGADVLTEHHRAGPRNLVSSAWLISRLANESASAGAGTRERVLRR